MTPNLANLATIGGRRGGYRTHHYGGTGGGGTTSLWISIAILAVVLIIWAIKRSTTDD